MNMNKRKTEKPELNVLPALFDAWKTLKRKKDSTTIANEYGWSKPTIDNALLYGSVKTERVTQDINHFFKARQDRELKQAQKLLGQSNQEENA